MDEGCGWTTGSSNGFVVQRMGPHQGEFLGWFRLFHAGRLFPIPPNRLSFHDDCVFSGTVDDARGTSAAANRHDAHRVRPFHSLLTLMHWIAGSDSDTAPDTLGKRLWAAADQFRANSGL